MCGRFVLTADPEIIQKAFNLTVPPEQMQPRFNIAPSQPVAVVTNKAPDELTHHRWGLVPSWSKDIKIGNKMINARAETLHEKPSFRAAYKRRRCLIPANGFYEWAKTDDGKKPMYIHMADHAVFAFAGLWEIWQDSDGNELRTCTIITTKPNKLVEPLHHRMAVILRPEDYDLWLSQDEMKPQELAPVLQPFDVDAMAVYEVSKTVNSPANDGPSLIDPVSAPAQPSLFDDATSAQKND